MPIKGTILRPRGKDITGQRFGMLVVLGRQYVPARRMSLWLCRCDCGGETLAEHSILRQGRTISCGCYQRRSDGWKRTRATWHSMKARCRDGKRYGGKGIKVCLRWAMSFENFLADMGERPPGMTLERRDNAIGYEPANCMWATPTQQARNRRTNRMLTAFGETKCVAEWLEDPRCTVGRSLLMQRLGKGWSHELALARSMSPEE